MKNHAIRNLFIALILVVGVIFWMVASAIGWFIHAIEDEEGTKTHVEKMEETFFSAESTSEEVYNEYYEEDYYEDDYYEDDYDEDIYDGQEVNSKGIN